MLKKIERAGAQSAKKLHFLFQKAAARKAPAFFS